MNRNRGLEAERNNFMHGMGLGMLAVGTLAVAGILANQYLHPLNLDQAVIKHIAFMGSFILLSGALESVKLPFMPLSGSQSGLSRSFPDLAPQLDNQAKTTLGKLAGAIVGISLLIP